MPCSPQRRKSTVPNGLGPWWFRAAWRRWLSERFSQYFDEASWEHHDRGYHRGHPSRAECDRKFLGAMLRDASQAPSVRGMAGRVAVSFTFWGLCRAIGWASYGRGQ